MKALQQSEEIFPMGPSSMLLCAFILICDEAGGALLFMLIITYCHILWCSISWYSSKSGIDVCLFKSIEKCAILAQHSSVKDKIFVTRTLHRTFQLGRKLHFVENNWLTKLQLINMFHLNTISHQCSFIAIGACF